MRACEVAGITFRRLPVAEAVYRGIVLHDGREFYPDLVAEFQPVANQVGKAFDILNALAGRVVGSRKHSTISVVNQYLSMLHEQGAAALANLQAGPDAA